MCCTLAAMAETYDDVLRAGVLERLDRGRQSATSGEHGVDNDGSHLGVAHLVDVVLELVVVGDGLEGLLVSVEAQMPDQSTGNCLDSTL